MQFTFIRHGDKTYIEWNIAEAVPMNGQHEMRNYPYVIRTVISPAGARVFAQSLLDAANGADDVQNGGIGLPPGMSPPPPPPKPVK